MLQGLCCRHDELLIFIQSNLSHCQFDCRLIQRRSWHAASALAKYIFPEYCHLGLRFCAVVLFCVELTVSFDIQSVCLFLCYKVVTAFFNERDAMVVRVSLPCSLYMYVLHLHSLHTMQTYILCTMDTQCAVECTYTYHYMA